MNINKMTDLASPGANNPMSLLLDHQMQLRISEAKVRNLHGRIVAALQVVRNFMFHFWFKIVMRRKDAFLS